MCEKKLRSYRLCSKISERVNLAEFRTGLRVEKKSKYFRKLQIASFYGNLYNHSNITDQRSLLHGRFLPFGGQLWSLCLDVLRRGTREVLSHSTPFPLALVPQQSLPPRLGLGSSCNFSRFWLLVKHLYSIHSLMIIRVHLKDGLFERSRKT